ncbi:MAG TPA: hypothetical protein VF043_13070 [Ktedonobacteraceae bacterium]
MTDSPGYGAFAAYGAVELIWKSSYFTPLAVYLATQLRVRQEHRHGRCMPRGGYVNDWAGMYLKRK